MMCPGSSSSTAHNLPPQLPLCVCISPEATVNTAHIMKNTKQKATQRQANMLFVYPDRLGAFNQAK